MHQLQELHAPPTVLLLSGEPINEPVVTVLLRVGCQQKLSKRYTFFAEPPTQVVEPVVPPAPNSRIRQVLNPPMATVSNALATEVSAAPPRWTRVARGGVVVVAADDQA